MIIFVDCVPSFALKIHAKMLCVTVTVIVFSSVLITRWPYPMMIPPTGVQH